MGRQAVSLAVGIPYATVTTRFPSTPLPKDSEQLLPVLRARCAALNTPLESAKVRRLHTYLGLLLDRRRRVNVTGIQDASQAECLLLLESIAAVIAAPKMRDAATDGAALRLLDVGTGGGIPGIPLAIAFPHLSVTLLEAKQKKVTFLENTIELLDLENVSVLRGRAEDLAHIESHREQYDLVTVRGVGTLATVAELALPFCREKGTLVAFKSLPLDKELASSSHAINVLGGCEQRITLFNIAELPLQHCVVTVTKSTRTPQKYPRRAGQPAKRPLSQS